jgi:hypothetical protein
MPEKEVYPDNSLNCAGDECYDNDYDFIPWLIFVYY